MSAIRPLLGAKRTSASDGGQSSVGMPYGKRAFGEEEGSILPGEYTALEQLGQRAADRLRRSQAEQQAGVWIGGRRPRA